jgi:DNA-binding winged helix-turn-helix (wHTH) protein
LYNDNNPNPIIIAIVTLAIIIYAIEMHQLFEEFYKENTMTHYYVLLIDECRERLEPLTQSFLVNGIPYEYYPNIKHLKVEYHPCMIILCHTKQYAMLENQLPLIFGQEPSPMQSVNIMVYGEYEDYCHIESALFGFADDFFILPVMPRLLIAKFSAYVRKHNLIQSHLHVKANCISYKNLIIDPSTKRMILNDKIIALTLTEFNIIYTLASNPSKIFSMDYLFSLITGQKSLGDYNAIMTHISRIRKKIARVDPHRKYILTIRNEGYRFNEKVILGQ